MWLWNFYFIIALQYNWFIPECVSMGWSQLDKTKKFLQDFVYKEVILKEFVAVLVPKGILTLEDTDLGRD